MEVGAAVNAAFLEEILDDVADGVYFLDIDRRITHWSRGAERLTGYRAEEVLGRSCADNILIHVDCDGDVLCSTATCPAAIAMRCGMAQEKRIFLKHKHGHRVPVVTKVRPILDDGGAVVGAAEVFRSLAESEDVAERVRRLEELALVDPMTGVGNRRLGSKVLEDRLAEFERYGWIFGVLFIDVDRFKQVNDIHGHDVGDRLLRMVAQTLLHNVRSFDSVIRWGGEEFVVLLSHMTQEHLLATAHKLQRLVASTNLEQDDFRLTVTVSIGAALVSTGDSAETLIHRVDKFMYESKRQGGDRVCVSEVPPVVPRRVPIESAPT